MIVNVKKQSRPVVAILKLFNQIHGGLSELFVPGRYSGDSLLREFGYCTACQSSAKFLLIINNAHLNLAQDGYYNFACKEFCQSYIQI
ncbi:hypothetical protein CHU33_22005 [Superficieibacter electus]|uniref:DUF3330 domain-containing protein n=1 Tax=Superficieibacter electus TaxID=2022662 RepID=A0ABX4Z963_9ENTR|nr:hypothetical protein CHU33_22005 [Superficieibacter electus]